MINDYQDLSRVPSLFTRRVAGLARETGTGSYSEAKTACTVAVALTF